jgi:hypothetical protein
MVQLQAILHTLCMIGSMERTVVFQPTKRMVPLPQRQIAATGLSRRGIRTVSWLAADSRDQWPVANASSVGNVAASHRFHYCADREMHLPEVLGWTATERMGPWCR